MTQSTQRTLVLVAILALPGIAHGQRVVPAPPAPVPAAVEVQTTLDRTAAWVGDRVVYTVDLRPLPAFDVVLDDLSQERLRVEGGEVLTVESGFDASAPRPVRRVRYTLVATRVDAAALRIPALVVRYYERRGDGTAEGAPVGQVVVPPAAVSIRSTLPDHGIVAGPRRPAALRPPPQWLKFLGPIGVILVAATVLPVLLYMLRAGPRARAGWDRVQRLRERRRRRQVFAEVKELTAASETDRIAAFQRLDGFVRAHFEAHAGVPAFALTPAEMQQALAAHGEAFPAEVERLLDRCERARYAPVPPTQEEWVDAVHDTERILHQGRR